MAGSASGSNLLLKLGQFVVGRDAAAHLSLPDSGISRHHARLTVSPDNIVTLEDLDSTNGVFLNGRRTDIAVIRCGDRIELGPDAVVRVGRAAEFDATAQQSTCGIDTLSARELEVARMVAKGLSNAAVGERLHISSSTVARHLANIFKRLQVSSRTALARLVIDSGRG